MLEILSTLNLVSRFDYLGSTWVLASGVTGTWVTRDATGVEKPTAGGFALPIWSESYRDGTTGKWSPDVDVTGKVTVIHGKLKALTDQFVGTPSVGAPLYVDTNGKLSITSAGNAVVVAYCTKASHTFNQLGTNYTCIEFMSV